MRYTLLILILTVSGTVCSQLQGQTLSLFSVSQTASSQIAYTAGTTTTFASDVWTGSYDLGVTGITNGSSSLPNPGQGSSGSTVLFADHTFNALSWDLNGSAQGTINAGLGNPGSSFPTISQTTIVSANLSFFIDTPFTINLQSALSSQFTGNEPYDPFFGRAQTKLFAQVIDGQLVNQYLADWDTFFGSTGGSYTGSFNSAVFRLEFGADAVLDANDPGAFLNQYSSYDLQMSVQPVPEPSGMLLIGVGAAFLGLRRRRRAVSTTSVF
ncbi:MAG: PEP-CTERM sorting domain-containing protein [Verrucomicrobia bacterium]|nr:PEP-CTERM sorting domain-containing protein [Verrucomicrobiota bacterium]